MTLATQLKSQKSPTYQVLDAIRAATTHQDVASSDRKANMSYLVTTTGLCGRTVNALVYALEKQGRVVAHSYEVPRREQVFTVLRYEPNEPRGLSDRSPQRCHPAKSTKSSIVQSASQPHHSLPDIGARLVASATADQAEKPSTRRRAEICSSTVRQRSRFHDAHPANREAHRESQAVEDFELLFSSFFSGLPAAVANEESDDEAELVVLEEVPAPQECLLQNSSIEPPTTPHQTISCPAFSRLARVRTAGIVRSAGRAGCKAPSRNMPARMDTHGYSRPFLDPPKKNPHSRSEEGMGVWGFRAMEPLKNQTRPYSGIAGLLRISDLREQPFR